MAVGVSRYAVLRGPGPGRAETAPPAPVRPTEGREGQKEIKLVYPGDGTFVTEESVVLVKNAPNAAAARRLYDMLLAKETQIALLESAFRRPSRNDIDVSKHVALPDLKSIKVFPVDDKEAQDKRTEFLAQWQAMQTN